MRRGLTVLCVLGCGGCADPFAPDLTPVPREEVCAASPDWLPITPDLSASPGAFDPLPHPASECPFYRAAWQLFLAAAQPDAAGEPAFKSFATMDGLFRGATPRPPPGPTRSWLGHIKQPGGGWLLLDQKGQLVYYGIHVNQAYADFIRDNGLDSARAIQDADPGLFLPSGVVMYKSAWQRVDAAEPSLSRYVTTRAWLPHVSQVAGQIVEDRDRAELATVRLLALHVVFALPGHPELVWATFEHSAGAPDLMPADGKRDVAPIDSRNVNPQSGATDALTIISQQDHLLYKGGTPIGEAMRTHPETELLFDEANQQFPGQQSSIYRLYPASKSNTATPEPAITSLNFNMEAVFRLAEARGQLSAADRRPYYRLVGALWLDKPGTFALDRSLQNDATSPLGGDPDFAREIAANGSDSPLSIVAGEDRLSSTAMETFTQGPDSFNNCFACHNTQATSARGVPFARDRLGLQVLTPKLLNVSRLLSQFVLEECGDSVVTAADGTRRIACP